MIISIWSPGVMVDKRHGGGGRGGGKCWRRLLLALLMLAAMVAWSRYFMALSEQRWRRERYCALACPVFYSSPRAREREEQASDWVRPLALSLAPWGLAAVVGVRRVLRSGVPRPRPGESDRST